MNIYIVCTVRNASSEYKIMLEQYVNHLESMGHVVHLPHRDTNQNQSLFDICNQNRMAIANANEIHIFYSSMSQGTHFDLGIAFAFGKKIKIVENESVSIEKSFPTMLEDWNEWGWEHE